MQIFHTFAYWGKSNYFNFVDLLWHNHVNHSKHIWTHRYIAKSHLRMDVCSRFLSPSIDKKADSFPFVQKEKRVLRTPSSFCLSKWGAASWLSICDYLATGFSNVCHAWQVKAWRKLVDFSGDPLLGQSNNSGQCKMKTNKKDSLAPQAKAKSGAARKRGAIFCFCAAAR